MSESDQYNPLARVPTGIPGLDAVTGGGLLDSGCYLVMGRPGAGKTVLGSQVAFRHAEAGGSVIYLTLLTESHTRLLSHLQSFSFFNLDVIGKSLLLISGYQELEREKLKGLLALIRKLVKERRSSMLIIDGIATAGMSSESELDFKKFIHELKVFVELVGCTALLLTGNMPQGSHYPAQTMVDGIIELALNRSGMRLRREMEILKLRGCGFLEGAHTFEITDDGLVVHPRVEAVYQANARMADAQVGQVGFGIPGLDSLLHGGMTPGSSTLVLGSPGSGKTLLGLQFLLDGVRHHEPGLYLGFYEEPTRLVAKAAGIGMRLADSVARGAITLLWKPGFELIGDKVAEELLAYVRRHKVKRLVLDGTEGLIRAHSYPDRAIKVLGVLAHELTALGVTTVFTRAAFPGGGRELELPRDGQTELTDNMILLERRFHEGVVSVAKMRSGGYDPTERAFRITGSGFEVGAPDQAKARPPANKASTKSRRQRKRR